jgi:hypothetical protein
MAFVDSVRKSLHNARAVAGRLGLHPYSVKVLRREYEGNSWDGQEAALEQAFELTAADGQKPKVRWVSTKDYLMGYPQDAELEVVITPELAAQYEDVDPVSGEVIFLVTGPGMTEGVKFQKVQLNSESAFSWRILLKRVSSNP